MKRRRQKGPDPEGVVNCFIPPPEGQNMGRHLQVLRWQLDFVLALEREMRAMLEALKEDLAAAEAVLSAKPPDIRAVIEVSKSMHSWVLLMLDGAEGEECTRLQATLATWEELSLRNMEKAQAILNRQAVALFEEPVEAPPMALAE
jgi:hypothetical protein